MKMGGRIAQRLAALGWTRVDLLNRGTVVFRSSAAAQRADEATPTVAERAKDL